MGQNGSTRTVGASINAVSRYLIVLLLWMDSKVGSDEELKSEDFEVSLDLSTNDVTSRTSCRALVLR